MADQQPEPFEDQVARARRGAWWLHLLVLILLIGMLVVAFALEPVAPGHERLTAAGVTLPEICSFKNATSLDCPGCGLTRSWVAAAHGNTAWSFRHHPLGWLIMLYVVVQVGRHGGWLILPPARAFLDRFGGVLDKGLIGLLILLVVAWPFRLGSQLGWW